MTSDTRQGSIWCSCLRSEDMRALYERHWPKLVAIAEQILHSRADAEEVAQEAMVRLAERYCSYRGDGSVAAWVTQIARRLALNRRRESSRRLNRERDDSGSPRSGYAPSTEDTVASREHLTTLSKALDTIPEDAARVLRLRLVEHKSIKEIALAERLAPGTVMSRLGRAKERLQRALAHRRAIDNA